MVGTRLRRSTLLTPTSDVPIFIHPHCFPFQSHPGQKFANWAVIGAFFLVSSPFVLCISIGQHVFKWEKDDWKTQLFTMVGGFGLYYLIVFLFFAPKYV